MRKHPHLNPIFPTTFSISKQHFQHPNNTSNIHPEHFGNNPFPLNNQTIHSQQTHQSTFTYSFDQRLSSSSSDLVNKNKNKRGKNANVARMKNNINTIAAKNTFAIIYRLPQTTTQRTTMKTERMPILSTHRTFSQLSLSSFNHSLSIHRTNIKRNTTTSLHSQEQPVPFTLRFDFFEFNFFNLNIRIGFFEQLHPNIYVLIRIPE